MKKRPAPVPVLDHSTQRQNKSVQVQAVWAVSLLVCFPIVLAIMNPRWTFTPLNYIDAWVYFGYFRHLVSYKSAIFPNLYYGSRLPWILPGYVAYSWFQPKVANYVLHFAFYYLAIFSMYDLLRRAVGARSALIGALLFGGHGPFLWAIGWDYVDGAGCTYFLVAMAAVARATRERSRLWLVICGMSAACMCYTNLFLVVFLPFFPALYLFIRFRGWTFRSIGLAIEWLIWCGLGASVISVALGAINYRIDGNFWFYSPSFRYALSVYKQANPWRTFGWEWMMRAYWLVVPTATFVASLGWIGFAFFRRTLKCGDYRSYFVLQFLAVAAGMLLWKTLGSTGLSLFFYASYMIPSMFLAIGSILSGTEDRWGAPYGWILALLTFVVLAMALRYSNAQFEQWLRAKLSLPVVMLLVALSLLSNVVFHRKWRLAAIAIAGLALYETTYNGLDAPSPAYEREWLNTVEGADRLWANEQKQVLLFWYNANGPHGLEIYAINAIYLWGYTYVGTNFPATEYPGRLLAGRAIAMLSGTGDWLGKVNDVLHRNHLEGTIAETFPVGHGAESFQISVVKLAEYRH